MSTIRMKLVHACSISSGSNEVVVVVVEVVHVGAVIFSYNEWRIQGGGGGNCFESRFVSKCFEIGSDSMREHLKPYSFKGL